MTAVARVAHDLGNTLQTIKLQVELLRRSSAGGAVGPRLDQLDALVTEGSAQVRILVDLARPRPDAITAPTDPGGGAAQEGAPEAAGARIAPRKPRPR